MYFHGYDIAPSAIEKSKKNLSKYNNANVSLQNLVEEPINIKYDALIDVMGLHMIVLDKDRENYVSNAYNCLHKNAPALFYRESYRHNASNIRITSIEQYRDITGCDFETLEKRKSIQNGKKYEVYIPLLPARALNEKAYRSEFGKAGFRVIDFKPLSPNEGISYSAAIYLMK